MDVKVNKAEWEALGDSERDRIQAIIGSQFQGTNVIPDPKAKESHDAIASRSAPSVNLSNPLCSAACGVAEAAAVAACSAIGFPPAIAVCIVLAHEAGNLCRSRC